MQFAEFIDHCMRSIRRVSMNDCTDARCFRKLLVDIPSGKFMTNPCVVRCANGLDLVAKQKEFTSKKIIEPWHLYNCAYFSSFYRGSDHRSRMLVLVASCLRSTVERCINRVADLEPQLPDDIEMLRSSALHFDSMYRHWHQVQEEIGRRIALAVAHCAKAAKYARKAALYYRVRDYGVTADKLVNSAQRLEVLAVLIVSKTYFEEHRDLAIKEFKDIETSYLPEEGPLPDVEDIESEIQFAQGLLASVEKIVAG